ncbi:F-box/kelch-repeat protein [Panicum miliaceum]|uniref:F-box/kelch-repeat protein n=1 Tax=Panicum miliaceum TaxID=4540 RepID=A0A3L6SXS3_PANMI|nr:F-box/kelch-repeat protein [Panicum miliaceum]
MAAARGIASSRGASSTPWVVLRKQPGIEELGLLHSCNGLLLFGHRRAGDTYDSLGFIVCHPATEQWVAVPNSGWNPNSFNQADESEESDADSEPPYRRFTYLVSDPAVSSHFRLSDFWTRNAVCVEGVRTYYSESGIWCKSRSTWSGEAVAFAAGSALVSDMLHFSVTSSVGREIHQELIVAVNVVGRKCRIISGPEKASDVAFVGQSQGCLHYMNQHRDNTGKMIELSIWVLQDWHGRMGSETQCDLPAAVWKKELPSSL